MGLKIIGFYTKNTPYEDEIKNLEASCKALGFEYEFVGYETRGNWVANCGMKPLFVSDMLDKHSCNLLYLDADAIIRKSPTLLLDTDVDIAAHIMQGNILLSGTVYFANNSRVRALVKLWVVEQQTRPQTWDQTTLQQVIEKHGKELGIKFLNLPKEYTKIYDKPWGEAVIEHMQASRRFKTSVNMSILVGVPNIVHGQRIRVSEDGSFYIPRHNTQAEEYLDKHYCRIPNELRWRKKLVEGKNIEELRPIFKGKKCYIIGKGPSLDELAHTAFDNPACPVICCNESIHKIEPLGLENPVFVIQQDSSLHDSCRPVNKNVGILISDHAKHWYAEDTNKYIFSAKQYGLVRTQLTAICAIEIAKFLGTNLIDMLCFDACVTKNIAYAKCVGYEPTRGGDPKRFLDHRKHLDNHLKNVKVNWVIPKAAKVPSLA